MKFLKRLTGEAVDLAYTGPTGGYLVVDVETSGLYPYQGHEVTWLGTAYVLPNTLSPGLSVAVAGTEGRAVFGDAPTSVPRHNRTDVVAWFTQAANVNQAVVAHNAAFDARFIKATFAAEKRPMPGTPWLCTMLLARHLFRTWDNHKLTTCLANASIPLPAEHDAAQEALATGQLLQFLLANAYQQGIATLSDLLEIARITPGDASQRRSEGPAAQEMVSIDLSDLTWDDISRPRPVCGELLLDDITDAAHRFAHEQVDALFGDGRQERINAYQALTDAGCPNAAKEWKRLPSWWGKGSKGEFDGAIFVLKKYREMGVADTEEVRGLCVNASADVFDLKNGPAMLLKAHTQLWEWLSQFGPCEMCERSGIRCDCFNFAVDAAKVLVHRIGKDQWQAFVDYASGDDSADPGALPPVVAEPLQQIRENYPIGYGYALAYVAQQMERDKEVELARGAFELAVATGYAPDTAYDRLSLMIEREKDFARAADLAEEGIRRTSSTTVTNTLTKRAARCRNRV